MGNKKLKSKLNTSNETGIFTPTKEGNGEDKYVHTHTHISKYEPNFLASDQFRLLNSCFKVALQPNILRS